MVTMCSARDEFTRSTIAASVVDLPEPVTPVTSTSPRGMSQICSTTLGRNSSSSARILVGMTRSTSPTLPRCWKMFTRKRPSPATPYALGPSLAAVKFCLLSALLVGLTFSDLEARILPDEFTLGGMAAGLVLAWFVPVNDDIAQVLLWFAGVRDNPHWASLGEAVLGAIVPGLFLWFGGWLYFKLRHREGLGLGDVKLVAMVGAFLGLHGAL